MHFYCTTKVSTTKRLRTSTSFWRPIQQEGYVTYYRGLSYLAKGDDTRGFADMAKGIELDPKRALYYYWRAHENAKRKNDDAALPDLDKSLELEADDDAYLLRAELYTRKNELEKAIADLTRAAEVNPTYPSPHQQSRSTLRADETVRSRVR